MGTHLHRAIFVTSASDIALASAHAKAVEIFTVRSEESNLRLDSLHRFDSLVTPVTYGVVNGYGTFTIVPDGSKLGWPESTTADRAREDFLCWLREQGRGLRLCAIWWGRRDRGRVARVF